MKRINSLLIVLATIILSSCGTYTYQESTARYVEPLRAGFISPVVADMTVSEKKIENTVEVYAELKKQQISDILSADLQGRESALVLGWKKYALAETLKKYNADDIVAPTFTITPSETKMNVLLITVTGHTAVYNNFRKATKNDVEMFAPFVGQDKDINVNGAVLLRFRR